MSSVSAPVLIGVAQATWRERDTARSPIDALVEVAEGALADCAAPRVRAAIDAVMHVPFILDQVPDLAGAMPRNPGAAIAARLGVRAAQYSADVGGNLPQQLLQLAAERVAKGEQRVVLLAGAELLNTFLGALRAGEPMPQWTADCEAEPEQCLSSPSMSAPAELAHGLFEPSTAYPLFESALRARHGLDAQAHRQRLGDIVSAMSHVAAANPLAWKPRVYSPSEVLSTEQGNRLICHPYTKLMNAIIAVDMAACVLLTSERVARELGVAPERCIYLRGASSLSDTRYLSERPQLAQSPALRRAATTALRQAELKLSEIDLLDLYSCFPAAVQVGCDALDLALDDPRGLTVTGGLTLFGGPGNNYSLHAIAEMVAQLRRRGRASGLLWANGGYLNKHAVGVYSTEPPRESWKPGNDAALQAELDALSRPRLVTEASGDMRIVASTVRYEHGEAALGIVLGELSGGGRCLAQTRSPEALKRLVTEDCVGRRGQVTAGDPVNEFRFSDC